MGCVLHFQSGLAVWYGVDGGEAGVVGRMVGGTWPWRNAVWCWMLSTELQTQAYGMFGFNICIGQSSEFAKPTHAGLFSKPFDYEISQFGLIQLLASLLFFTQ